MTELTEQDPSSAGSETPGVPLALPITTERLTLRTYREDDLEPTLAYYSLPEVARYIPFEPWTRELAAEQLTKRMRRTGVGGDEKSLGLVVEHAGQVIGDVVVWCADDTRQRGEMGWAFRPDVAGQGFATEAVRALIDLALGHYGMQRVFAQLDARNGPSARLCERVGMSQEAHLRRDWWGKGEWSDTLVYGLLREEWNGLRLDATRGPVRV
jgi:RimJ/RimL family protein N-acetyltransferase